MKCAVDIGANISNHLVLYAQHIAAKRIYPFEPNPESVSILRNNIALNGLNDIVDHRGIGLSLGRQRGKFSVTPPIENNLDASGLVED